MINKSFIIPVICIALTLIPAQGGGGQTNSYTQFESGTYYGRSYDPVKKREYGVRITIRYRKNGKLNVIRHYDGVRKLHDPALFTHGVLPSEFNPDEENNEISLTLPGPWQYVFIPFDMDKNYVKLSSRQIKLVCECIFAANYSCKPFYDRQGKVGFNFEVRDTEVTSSRGAEVTVESSGCNVNLKFEIEESQFFGAGVIVPARDVGTLQNVDF